jgi:hypothetical protein
VFGTAGREVLLENVLQLPSGPRGATRGRRALVVALAAAVVVAVATAATWAILGSSAHETTSIECVIQGTDTIVPAVSGDPAYDCAVVWQNDVGTVPPPLAAYDNGHGGVTVIPRNQKPQTSWKPMPDGQDVALIQLRDSLDDYVAGLNSSCLGADAATALAETTLKRFGFTDWTVSVRNTGSCANADVVDPASKTVTLISGPADSGPETPYQKLADRLRALTAKCQSLPAAVASVRAAANGLPYDLHAVADDSLRCASIYETVGGAIVVTVRGPDS